MRIFRNNAVSSPTRDHSLNPRSKASSQIHAGQSVERRNPPAPASRKCIRVRSDRSGPGKTVPSPKPTADEPAPLHNAVTRTRPIEHRSPLHPVGVVAPPPATEPPSRRAANPLADPTHHGGAAPPGHVTRWTRHVEHRRRPTAAFVAARHHHRSHLPERTPGTVRPGTATPGRPVATRPGHRTRTSDTGRPEPLSTGTRTNDRDAGHRVDVEGHPPPRPETPRSTVLAPGTDSAGAPWTTCGDRARVDALAVDHPRRPT